MSVVSSSPATHDTLLDGYRSGNRLLGSVLAAHVIVAFAAAFVHDTWVAAASVGLPLGLGAFALSRWRPEAVSTRLVVGAAFMGFSGLFIHQAHGMIEAHFHVFASLAFLLVYRDWKVIVAAAATIAVHHVAGHFAQHAGVPIYVLNHDGGFGIIVLHAAFVVFESAILVWIALKLAAEARESSALLGLTGGLAEGRLDIEVPGDTVAASAYRTVVQTLRRVADEAEASRADVVAHRAAQRGRVTGLTGAFASIVGSVHDAVDAAHKGEAAIVEERTLRTAWRSDLEQVLKAVDRRDMTVRMQTTWAGPGGEQYSALAVAFNRVIDQLADALREVRASAEQVTGAATQIAEGAEHLASGTGQQASSLEEVSASVKTLGQISQQNATSAAEAQQVSEQTRHATTDGYTKMQELLGAMADIKSSAESTAKIVKTIDEIAFQTNLLALNAAVEAARAGDAGRGFAVVAEEVRALAQRSAEAARNTSALIDESVRKVFAGEGLTKAVYQQLDDIRHRVNALGDVMREIGQRSDDQRSGVTQIDQAIELVNGAVQQAAANAEESASAAQELTAQARSQLDLVGSFRLESGGTAAPAPNSGTPVARPTPSLVKSVPAGAPATWRTPPKRTRLGTPRSVPVVKPPVKAVAKPVTRAASAPSPSAPPGPTRAPGPPPDVSPLHPLPPRALF